MARNMMNVNMIHNDMAEKHATGCSSYAGSSSFFGGFYWYAYFDAYRYRLKRVNTALS